MIRNSIVKEINEILHPLDSIMHIGGPYVKNFFQLFDSFKAMKDAIVTLKTG